jgi:hypothetical protein
MQWVKGDSKARLLKEGVIGANVIEITLGSEKEKPLEHNAVIAFERERGLGQVVDQLYAEVIPLIDDLKRVARRADTLLAGLPATQQKLDTALTSATKNFENLKGHGLRPAGDDTAGKETVEEDHKSWIRSAALADQQNIKEPRSKPCRSTVMAAVQKK